MKKSKTVLDRIFKHIEVKNRNHWIWSGTRESSGIPKVYVAYNEKKHPYYKSVVRVLWDDEHREKLKDDEFLVNTCKAKDCVNPKHYEKMGAGAQRLSSEQAELICEYFERGSPVALLAREFGVARNTAAQAIIKSGKKIRGGKK